MQYPLELTFQSWMLAPKLFLADHQGKRLFWLSPKSRRFDQPLLVFTDQNQTEPCYTITADRILDVAVRYDVLDRQGQLLASLRRRGLRSLWRSRYDVFEADFHILTIQEVNPWIHALDNLFFSIPGIGWLLGCVVHPTYVMMRPNGTVVLRLKQQTRMGIRQFVITKVDYLSDREEIQALLSLLLLFKLKRDRN
jgi:hypothetical protein